MSSVTDAVDGSVCAAVVAPSVSRENVTAADVLDASERCVPASVEPSVDVASLLL